jgi:mannosylglycerate hydrolase
MQKIHIIPHTHWDREWYKPFQYFRIKLVFVIDKLIQILEEDQEFRSFLLDGQTIVLEDYLEIKPGNRDRLKNLISAGRIQVGPWYIQPDEFAPDGESLVRNLLIGTRIAKEFGRSMQVGYLPDSFGHSGQMPQILNGFGISSAVVMRGIDADTMQKSEFRWIGIDGAEVLAIYLPQGYSNGMFLPEGYREFKYRLLFTVRSLRKWATTNNILIMNGVDHQFPQAQIPAHIAQLNKGKKKSSYRISTLEDYIEAVRAENPVLPVLNNDLLVPVRNRVHSSIASTRIYQKQKNRRMEALLEKYVEPIITIAWIKNTAYPTGLINQAWKILIQNQTHDGICGCCLDEVHREMDQRFVDVKNIGETLQNIYARAIARRISCDDLSLTVFNNAFTKGRQIVKASIFTNLSNFTISDSDGNTIPYQIDQIEDVDLSEKSIWTLYLKGNESTKKYDITFSAEFDFNIGYKVYKISKGESKKVPGSLISVTDNVIENEFIRVEINKNGSLNLMDKQTKFEYQDLHIFEDCGDAGDTYNYSPVKNDTIITSKDILVSYKITREGPFSCEVTINYALNVPVELINQDQNRSNETVILPITTRMTIYSEHKRLDFQTRIDNTARDHRLRILFPSGIKTDYSWAETQFGIIQRETKPENKDWEKKKWHEKPLPIYSQQKFIDLNDGNHGLAVLNRGLPEYEIYPDETSTIAITLIRSVGLMGKGDLLVRPGRPSGINTPTPDAQCSGIQVLEYSIFPHAGGTDQENLTKHAVEYDAAPLAVQNQLKFEKMLKKYGLLLKLISLETLNSHVYDKLEDLDPVDFKLAAISNDRLIISAVKKAEDDQALIIRFYNSGTQPVVDASIELKLQASCGFLADLNEDQLGALETIAPGVYRIPEVKPNSVVTLYFPLTQ